MQRAPRQTREVIVEAADRLFYAEGIRKVGVDAIAAEAGVTKRTLYYHFKSKDELVAAYLESRHAPTLAMLRRTLTGDGDLQQRVRGFFLALHQRVQSQEWKGCLFLRTVAELRSEPGHPALEIAAGHKEAVEDLFREHLEASGASQAPLHAQQLLLLYDGTIIEVLVRSEPDYALAAGDAAARIVGAALAAGTAPE
ncbi:TetR family transcriptional regulator [Spiribacter halobius]|uniref:TetR family transcriptional regulator n=2 Tax=Sediminicurvatus halobius TaxID=2182432 RepID=A0A2U2MYH6_9GAMM|nr:TetR family transcriptional regulator [Spiribacter halobius]